MRTYSLTHLDDDVLLRNLTELAAQERTTTAALLAYIAEVDARRLYAPAGFPSMFLFCLLELRLSEEAAYKRIHAARAARRFPVIFPALADGRLHLSAVVLLAPYLTEHTASDLLNAAEHKTKSEIEKLLAQRFPRPDLPSRVQALGTPLAPNDSIPEHAPGRVHDLGLPPSDEPARESVALAETDDRGPVASCAPEAPVSIEAPRPKLTPLAPERFGLQVTIDQATYDQLRYAQALLSHQIPSGDLARVLARVVELGVARLEKGRFAATESPREAQELSTVGRRYVPAAVKRAVWARDGGQCGFVSATGQRCPARTFLEFDHLDPVALGGEATVERMALRCRAHNVYEAERVFGKEFMKRKQEDARHRAAARTRERARTRSEARARAGTRVS